MVRALAVLLLAAGCDPGFEVKSRVIDLRLLGMRADPPEVVEDFDVENPILPEVPPITVEVLLADPGTDRRLEWSMSACPPDRQRRCVEDPVVPMGEGVIEDPEAEGAAPITASLAASGELLLASFEGDQQLGFGGLQVMVELKVWPEGTPEEEAIFGAKMLVYAPRIPAERVANVNPTIDTILVDETEEWAGPECRGITAGAEVRLEPVETEGTRETYVLPTLDGGSRMITENLRYSWFATAGSFSAEATGGPVDFFGNPPPLHTRWEAPSDLPSGANVTLWLVQRDERGGTSWTTRCFTVSLP